MPSNESEAQRATTITIPAGVAIIGTGKAKPGKVVSNDDLSDSIDTNDEWISQRTGIRQRYVVTEGQNIRTLAVDATNQAIANAGITSWGEFFSFQPEAFDRLLNVNLKGTFFLAQKSSKYMKENGGGSILMTSSVTGHQACKDLAAYGMTKAAIEMLAKALVIDLSPFNININFRNFNIFLSFFHHCI